MHESPSYKSPFVKGGGLRALSSKREPGGRGPLSLKANATLNIKVPLCKPGHRHQAWALQEQSDWKNQNLVAFISLCYAPQSQSLKSPFVKGGGLRALSSKREPSGRGIRPAE